MTLIEEQVIDTCGYSRECLVSYLRVWLKQKLLKLEIFDFMVWFQKDIKRYVNHKIKDNDVQTHKIRQVLKGLSFGKFSLSTFRRKGHIDKWVKKPTYYHFSCLGSGSCESNKKIYNSISSFWSLLKYYFFLFFHIRLSTCLLSSELVTSSISSNGLTKSSSSYSELCWLVDIIMCADVL